MAGERGPTERQLRFAVAYARLANGTKAALEAGYAQKSAHVTASQLIRDPKVQALIESYRIRRDVHADITYANIINLAEESLKLLQSVLNDPSLDLREKCMAFENARRCNETLAQCEGLTTKLPERKVDEARATLQLLAQRLRNPEPITALPSPQPPVEGSAA